MPGTTSGTTATWGATGPLFEVSVPDLHTGAAALADDSDDASSATTTGITGASAAEGSCGGGPLGEALGFLGCELLMNGEDLVGALAAAGTTAALNAAAYLDQDGAASASFSAWGAGTSLVG